MDVRAAARKREERALVRAHPVVKKAHKKPAAKKKAAHKPAKKKKK